MPVTITINGDNAAQAIEEFATLSASFGGSSVPVAPVQEESKQRQRKASADKKEQRKEEPVQEDGDGAPVSEAEDMDIPSVVDLRAKAQEVGKDPKKKPAIKKLLEEFDCKAVSDVPEEKRIAFMAALEEL